MSDDFFKAYDGNDYVYRLLECENREELKQWVLFHKLEGYEAWPPQIHEDVVDGRKRYSITMRKVTNGN